MRKYLYSETGGFVEKNNWLPNCWVNVECPTDDDFKFLREDLKVPTSFLNDIADTDERPRTDTEGNWLLTIYVYPYKHLIRRCHTQLYPLVLLLTMKL